MERRMIIHDATYSYNDFIKEVGTAGFTTPTGGLKVQTLLS